MEFSTSLGWKGYGDGENLNNLKDIDHSAAAMGLFTVGRFKFKQDSSSTQP